MVVVGHTKACNIRYGQYRFQFVSQWEDQMTPAAS